MTGIEEAAAAVFSAIGSETVVSSAAAAATAAVVGSALQPKAPGVKAPAAMPDQSAIDQARRRSLTEQLARRGRASTILSQPEDTLG